MTGLERLMRPRSIAVIGGGFWGRNVLTELDKIGFPGPVWHVHPTDGFARLSDLPSVPDAAFIGVNRGATLEIVRELSAMGAGGAVCFASGFAEATAEIADAEHAQNALLEAAGEMAILGPNCYGLINALDRVALWPDQHGAVPVARGVGLITQSSNIAINLTMQSRGLPIGAVVTAGNQAQQGIAEIGRVLIDDPRITALGLHIEGVGDTQALHVLALEADRLGKPIVVLKVGSSEQAQAATISHTASLAGSEAGAKALFKHLGCAQVHSLDGFLEALKIAHLHGRLPSAQVASLSCSGGEASLMADLGQRHGIDFPPLRRDQEDALRAALGPRVALANPLDYHTYIWGDEASMAAAFAAMMTEEHALGLLVLDVPRADRCDPTAWDPAFRAVAKAQEMSGRPMAVLASLPETLPEPVAEQLLQGGVLPLAGMSAALEAIAAMAVPPPQTAVPAAPRTFQTTKDVAEPEAKRRLASWGVSVPQGGPLAKNCLSDVTLSWPVVAKSVGQAHKSDEGGVILGIEDAGALRVAAERLPGDTIFVEEMQRDAVAEVLLGIVSDPAHGLVLTLGRGGTETELHEDVAHLLLPATAEDITACLAGLRMAPLFQGYRNRPAIDMPALVTTVLAVQEMVLATPSILEIEINPLLCLPDACVAVDALIREGTA